MPIRNRRDGAAPRADNTTLPPWLLVIDAGLAIALVLLLVVVLFFMPSPTPDQRDVLRLLTSVLFGALGASLTGTATLKISTALGSGSKVAISATAGLALLLIAYLVPPYWNPPTPTKGDCVQSPTQRGC